MQSSQSGVTQTFYDVGRGFNEQDSGRLPVRNNKMVLYRFPLPEAQCYGLRFDPLDRGNSVIVIRDVRIVDMSGRTVRDFSPADISARENISRFEVNGNEMNLSLGSADMDSQLRLNTGPMLLHASPARKLFHVCGTFLTYFLPLGGAGILWLVFGRRISRIAQPKFLTAATWAQTHPRRAVLLVATISVCVSCYPIIFLGRSFVSGNLCSMLYSGPPALPGYEDSETEDFKNSDIGAMMWQSLPYSFVEGRALARYAELPLWNRYNSCGVTLLGQGQSMFGDPLHLLVLSAGETAWAWDLKFLVAKILFCCALGLAVLASTKHLPAALLLSFSSAFIGFFSYRFDHPAFFSMCYAPWTLLCWIELSQAPTARRAVPWIAALLLASWTELTSGTVKEAYMLLLSMHLCGLIIFLKSSRIQTGRRKLFHLAFSGAAFLLLAAPVSLTFWGALNNSYTGNKGAANAWQIQPGMLIGLFDEIFYRAVNPGGHVFDPSANFFVLLGCIFALLIAKSLRRDPVFVGLGLSAILLLALVFGIIPPSLIEMVPMVNHVWHTDNTFSCALIIELIILAGFGVRGYFQQAGAKYRKPNFGQAAAVLFVLLSLYLGLTQAHQQPPNEFKPLGYPGSRDIFFYAYSFSLIIAFLALPWSSLAIIRKHKMAFTAVPIATLCLISLHWRHGFQIKTGVAQIDAEVVNPPVRANFHAPSAAVNFVRQQSGPEVFRTVGFGDVLFAGYNGMVALETISGPDALMNPYYHELLQSSGITLTWGWRAKVEKANFESLLPLYSLLNVRYFLDEAGSLDAQQLNLLPLASLDLTVYGNHTAWPRAFFTNQVQQYDRVSDFLQLVKLRPGQPIAAVQTSDLSSIAPRLSSFLIRRGPAQISAAREYKLTNNSTSFTINAPAAGVAVLTEAYVGGDFIARVNGIQCDYFRVNHAFRGVVIPSAGTYMISFSYWPKHFTASLIMFGAGLTLLIGWLLIVFRPALFKSRGAYAR